MLIKSLFRQIVFIFSFLVFFIPALTLAETKTFVKEYTYQASEADSKLSSRTIALEQVKRLLIEEIGTYLTSQTEVINFKITTDKISTLTAGIVRTEIMRERWDGKTYYLKAKISADPKELISSLDSLRKDTQKTKELEEVRDKAERALKEIEKIKGDILTSRDDVNTQKRYNETVKKLSSVEWFEKANSYFYSRNYYEAIKAYDNAIEADPRNAIAYSGRAVSYFYLTGNCQQAVIDYTKAIEVNPNLAHPYNGRGACYMDFDGNYQMAMKDFNRAIELDPAFANAYFNRGVCYARLGNWRQTFNDTDRAIAIGHPELDLSKAYAMRGAALNNLNDFSGAVEDLTKAIEINPSNQAAYCNRGNAYAGLGNYQQAWSDRKTAANLGSKVCQDFLRSKGISW